MVKCRLVMNISQIDIGVVEQCIDPKLIIPLKSSLPACEKTRLSNPPLIRSNQLKCARKPFGRCGGFIPAHLLILKRQKFLLR